MEQENEYFSFRLKSKYGYTDYSGKFRSLQEAIKWYKDPERGMMLRNLFHRELFLFYMGRKVDLNMKNI